MIDTLLLMISGEPALAGMPDFGEAAPILSFHRLSVG